MDYKWHGTDSYSNISLHIFFFITLHNFQHIDTVVCTNQSLAAGSSVALRDPRWVARRETSGLVLKSWPPGAHVPSVLTEAPAGQMQSTELKGLQFAVNVEYPVKFLQLLRTERVTAMRMREHLLAGFIFNRECEKGVIHAFPLQVCACLSPDLVRANELHVNLAYFEKGVVSWLYPVSLIKQLCLNQHWLSLNYERGTCD